MFILAAAFAAAGCGLFGGDTTNTSPVTTAKPPDSTTSSTAAPVSTTTSTTSAPTTTEATTTTTKPSSTTVTKPPTTGAPSSTTAVKPGKSYSVLPTKEKVVALTFDAAYDPAPLKGILAALEAADADATFFLTGEFVRDFPDHTKLIIDAGHPIGNHSYSHPDFTELSADRMRDEIRRTSAALVKLGAPDPAPLFRPPFGAYDKRVLSVLANEGYVSVYWTIDTLDWMPERTPEQIRSTVLNKLVPGAIVLMHVGSKQELQVLPGLLEEIAARGYRFVNLRDALPEAGGGG